MTDFAALYDNKEEYIFRRDIESYSAKRIALEIEHYKIPNLLEVLPKNFVYSSIAEIGCATGEIIGTFPGADIKHRVGFDISPLNIRVAQQRFPKVTFRAGDFRSSIEKFDLVILSDILEHIPDEVEFLRDAAQIAKVVLVNLPLEKCFMFLFRQYGPDDTSGHLRNYSLSDGLQLLENAGLSIINYRQKWSFESEYEPLRQKLNESMRGKKFSGGLLQRTIKAAIFQSLGVYFKGFGRKVFPSNLFVAARMGG